MACFNWNGLGVTLQDVITAFVKEYNTTTKENTGSIKKLLDLVVAIANLNLGAAYAAMLSMLSDKVTIQKNTLGKDILTSIKKKNQNIGELNANIAKLQKQYDDLEKDSTVLVQGKAIRIFNYDGNDFKNTDTQKEIKNRFAISNDSGVFIFADSSSSNKEHDRTKLQSYFAQQAGIGIPLKMNTKLGEEQTLKDIKKDIDNALNLLELALNSNKSKKIDLPEFLGKGIKKEIAEYVAKQLKERFGIHYEVQVSPYNLELATLVTEDTTHPTRQPKPSYLDEKKIAEWEKMIEIANTAAAVTAELVLDISPEEIEALSFLFDNPEKRQAVHNFFARGFSSMLDVMIYKKLREIVKKKKEGIALTDAEENLKKAWKRDKQKAHHIALSTDIFRTYEGKWYPTGAHAVIDLIEALLDLDEDGLRNFIQEQYNLAKDPTVPRLWFVDDLINFCAEHKDKKVNSAHLNFMIGSMVSMFLALKNDNGGDASVKKAAKAQIWREVAFDLYYTEKIFLSIKENSSTKTVEEASKEGDVEEAADNDASTPEGQEKTIPEDTVNNENIINRVGDFYLIKMRELSVKDTLTERLKFKFSNLYIRDKKTGKYIYDSLGGRSRVSPAYAVHEMTRHFANTKDEIEFVKKIKTAAKEYPWFAPMAEQMVPSDNPNGGDIELRNQFYRCFNRYFNQSIYITTNGVAANLNNKGDSRDLIKIIDRNWSSGNVLTENVGRSLYGPNGEFNASGFSWWRNSTRKDGISGLKGVSILEAQKYIIYDESRKNNKESTKEERAAVKAVFEVFNAINKPFMGGSHSIIEERLRSIGVDTSMVDLEFLIPKVPKEQQNDFIENPDKFKELVEEQLYEKILLLLRMLNYSILSREMEAAVNPLSNRVGAQSFSSAASSTISIINSCLKVTNPLYNEDQYLFAGKMQLSYTYPGKIDIIINSIGLNTNHTEEDIAYGDSFLEEEYLQYPFFAENPLFQRFMGRINGREVPGLKEEIREAFELKYLKALGGAEDKFDFSKIDSNNLIYYTVLGYFSGDLPGRKYHYGLIPSPLFSDAGKQVVFRLPKLVEKNSVGNLVAAKGLILEHLADVAISELNRMLEGKAPKNGEVEFYEKNKNKFVFFPYLNESSLLKRLKAQALTLKDAKASDRAALKKALKDVLVPIIAKNLEEDFSIFKQRFISAAAEVGAADTEDVLETIESVQQKLEVRKKKNPKEILDKEDSEDATEDSKAINLYYDTTDDSNNTEFSKLSTYYPNEFTDKVGKKKVRFTSILHYVIYRKAESFSDDYYTKRGFKKEDVINKIINATDISDAWDAYHEAHDKGSEDLDLLIGEIEYIEQGFKLLIEQKPEIRNIISSLGDSAIIVKAKGSKDLIGNGALEEALNNIREEEFGQRPVRSRRSQKEIQLRFHELLEDFYYNFVLQQTFLLELEAGDPAQYKNFDDLIKRNKQCYTAGQRGFAMEDFKEVQDANGKFKLIATPIMENSMYLEDLEVFSPDYTSMREVIEAGINRKGIGQLEKQMMLGAAHSLLSITTTDGFSWRTIKGFRKLLVSQGIIPPNGNDAVNQALDRMEAGTMTSKDLWNIVNQIKPFVMTKETQIRDGRKVKFTVLKKNSEYILGGFIGALNQYFNESPEIAALFEIADKYDIDVFCFHSAIKTGYNHGIDITYNEDKFKRNEDSFKGSIQEYRTYLAELVEKGILTSQQARKKLNKIRHSKDSAFKYLEDKIIKDSKYIHQSPLRDVMIMQPSDDHLTDAYAKEGSQFRNIITADLPEEMILKATDSRRALNHSEILSLWNALHVYSHKEGYENIAKLMSDPKTFEQFINNQVVGNPRFNLDMIRGLSIVVDKKTNKSTFYAPSNSPAMVNKVSALLMGQAKKNILHLHLPGGNAVLASSTWTDTPQGDKFDSYGLDDSLKVVTEEDENGKKRIVHMECMMPADSAYFIKDFKTKKIGADGKEYWTVDIKKIEKENPKLLERIGFRIPTEAKYSMVTLKIVGFLPSSYGNSIMLPSAIVSLSGSDFDIDKLYLIKRHFFRTIYKKGWNKLKVLKEFEKWKNKKENVKKYATKSNQEKWDIFKKSNSKYFLDKPKYITPALKIKEGENIIEKVKKASRMERENGIFDLAWDILTSPEGSALVARGASYAKIKKTSRRRLILRDKKLCEKLLAKYGSIEASVSYIHSLELDTLLDFIDEEATPANILSPNTYIDKHRNLMDGNALIGVYAVSSSSHYKFLNAHVKIAPKNQFYLGNTLIEDFDQVISSRSQRLITQICSEFQAASPDNGKDPVLGDLGINYTNANLSCCMARLGFEPEEIGIVNDSEDLAAIGKGLYLSLEKKGKKEDILHSYKIDLFKIDCLKMKYTLGLEFTDDDKLELIKYYVWRENIKKIANAVRMLNALDRVDSPSAALPTTEAEYAQIILGAKQALEYLKSEESELIGADTLVNPNLALECNYDMEKIEEEILKSPVPRIQSAWTYGIELATVAMEDWLPNLKLREVLLEEFQTQTGKRYTTKGKIKEVKMLYSAFNRYRASKASIFCGEGTVAEKAKEYLKRRNSLIYNFPMQLNALVNGKNPSEFAKKVRQLNFFNNVQINNRGIKITQIGGIDEQTRTLYRQEIESLLTDFAEHKTEAQQLLVNLFTYSYFQDGSFFGHSSIGPFFSTLVQSHMISYFDTINQSNEELELLAANHSNLTDIRKEGFQVSSPDDITNCVFLFLLNNPDYIKYIRSKDVKDIPQKEFEETELEVAGKKKKVKKLKMVRILFDENEPRTAYFLQPSGQPYRLINLGGTLLKLVNIDNKKGRPVLEYVPAQPYNRKSPSFSSPFNDFMEEFGGQKKTVYFDYYNANIEAFDIKTEDIYPAGPVYNIDYAKEKIELEKLKEKKPEREITPSDDGGEPMHFPNDNDENEQGEQTPPDREEPDAYPNDNLGEVEDVPIDGEDSDYGVPNDGDEPTGNPDDNSEAPLDLDVPDGLEIINEDDLTAELKNNAISRFIKKWKSSIESGRIDLNSNNTIILYVKNKATNAIDVFVKLPNGEIVCS